MEINSNNLNNKAMLNNQTINQTISNNQNEIKMNNNTTTPQEFQYTLEQAINIVKQSPSSIWRTEDVLNIMCRIKEKELVIEVPVEAPVEKDMEQVIEEQEIVQGIYDLFEDIETSLEAVESSIDNIEVDTNHIELSLQGNEIFVDNVDIDGKAEALSDLNCLRSEMFELKKRFNELKGKEEVK